MLLLGWGLIPTVWVHRGNTTYYAWKTTLGKFTVCDPKVYFFGNLGLLQKLVAARLKKKKKGSGFNNVYSTFFYLKNHKFSILIFLQDCLVFFIIFPSAYSP